jgi:hypothetical protein
MGSERRQHIRVRPEPEHPVRVDINGENFLDILHACDVSEGGIGFRVDHCFTGCAIERPVHFIIALPEPVNALVSAEGLLRHIGGRAFGIEFGPLSTVSQHALHEYVHHRLHSESLLMRMAHSLHVPDSFINRL